MSEQSRSRQQRPRKGGRPRQGGGQRSGPPQPRDPARRVAYDVLRAVEQRDAYANLLLPSLLNERGIHGRDAALATELTYGTLRRQGTYDAILETCVDRSLSSVDEEVLPLLRLGSHQLLSTNIPPHAAVSETVDLARRVVGHHRGRFVNAILRKVSARDLEAWTEVIAPDRERDPSGYLSVVRSHPRWVVKELARALGERSKDGLVRTEELLIAHNERPKVTLVAKPGRAKVADLEESGAVPARYSPFAAHLPEGDPGAIREVRQNRAAVQDEASQLVALALSRVDAHGSDGLWLDMCAGPGGKAGLLASLAGQGTARLVASELQPARAGLVANAVRRAPRDAGRVIAADGTRPAWKPGSFDRVLADVPCTGLGALRRRPESRWRRGPEDVARLAPLQHELLTRAVEAARPGGVVAYVTCSPHLDETDVIVRRVLGERGDLELLRAPDYLDEVPDLAAGPEGRYVQFWPHVHGTDAMFLALFRKKSD
ncbi:rRNA cytosine-C5-methyltransferase [Nocardiopsis terrae]|uniref:16S rRNA (Cytosine967-C5)-methyltransferase n=1 Tax=Nocardiopsis terrae TaxID=372655 RepID=A0ABR9HJZ0_9ACTN|nr:transcription antitermination factor NusB [Nocardiopsis terrae]MBE1459210.1 16S rRNA (cytosine967-C5)-methyltransferase [Nocardiopsis terrae]GHC88768.1 rRNA cytosine-C5-methyltransferase [Nocardiopsis terrae]